MHIRHFSQDIKEDNIVLSFEPDGTIHAAKLIDWGMARMRRRTVPVQPPMHQPAAPANPRPDGGDDATLRDDVPSGNFFADPANPADEDCVPVGMQAQDWLHSRRGMSRHYTKNQHAPELLLPDAQFTPQSDLWAVGAMALHPLLFCCCSTLMQEALESGYGLGSRMYLNQELLKKNFESVSRRFLDEFQKNVPRPTHEETMLFEALFREYELM
jgi:serine/threonine protein kinase